MRIKDISKENRPRERLLTHGSSVLSDAEILAVILQKGTKDENVIDMSNRLISKYGLEKLSELSLKELQEIKGIGPAKAMQIVALFELNKRHNLARVYKKQVSSAEDIFNHFYEKLKDEKQEVFIILSLNNRNWIINEEAISRGTLDNTTIHPREIFKSAIKNSASKIVLVHNHPSRDPSPSEKDRKITDKLIEASELLGITLQDHVIIGENKWWSWREEK